MPSKFLAISRLNHSLADFSLVKINGIPVATVALNAAKNAGILAAQILGTSDSVLSQRLLDYKEELKQKVEESAREMENN
jgi:5-(carboxyamino)imidazole ribonucleotide mutase